MLSTLKTYMYGYFGMDSRMLAYSLIVSSLPFRVVLERCTTLARLDLGMI